ncbi:putative folate/pteridine transporter [Trypanosoma cruzi]|uniref:Putative folate/pteridine transporter n=1 Tax=Trypanosoma cruzi TaxID=5693 RepID=A0A2V2WSM2_TRYCR|nr:putative folate/pteridine transporter [Trypanosoma cruzi]
MATDDSAPPRIMSAEETVPARSVHIDARALFSALPCLRRAPIFGTSVEAFGPKCVLSMGLSEFLCKGVADFLIRCSLFPMFRRRYGVDAMTYQRMANLASMGWSMKPITAMFSDIFSFFGYTKRWYLAVSCVVGAAFALAFALLPPAKASAAPAAAFVFLTSFTKANVDILTQGHYSRLIRRIPLAGSSLVSWVWWGAPGLPCRLRHCRALADASLEWIGVIVAATLQFVTTFFFVMNWYGENKNRVNRAEDANSCARNCWRKGGIPVKGCERRRRHGGRGDGQPLHAGSLRRGVRGCVWRGGGRGTASADLLLRCL